MCELLMASFDDARSFDTLAPIVGRLEQLGLGGFGWGVAWLDQARGTVQGRRGLGRFEGEALADAELLGTASRRFLVHLRRPSRLSTVQMADTQPFFDDGRFAWCHNGYLDRAEELRRGFPGRLHGRADSEVGWQYFLDRRAAGDDVLSALRAVDDAFGGKVNLATLGADGEICVYSRNETNRMWQFTLDGGTMAATDLHSDDSSLFDLVIPLATDRRRIEAGTGVRIARPVRTASSVST